MKKMFVVYFTLFVVEIVKQGGNIMTMLYTIVITDQKKFFIHLNFYLNTLILVLELFSCGYRFKLCCLKMAKLGIGD